MKKQYPHSTVSPYKQFADASAPKVLIDSHGFAYGVNPDGSIAWKEAKLSKPKRNGMGSTYKKDGFTVWDEDGNEFHLPYNPKVLVHHARYFPYMEEIAIEIASRVADGMPMSKISASPGMPPVWIIAKWRGEYPTFNSMIVEARKVRAEGFHDEMMDVKDTVDEDNAKSAKVKADILKHLAAVGNPDDYGSKTKITGDANAPLNFVFQTGISREPLPLKVEEGLELEECTPLNGNLDGIPTEAPPADTSQ